MNTFILNSRGQSVFLTDTEEALYLALRGNPANKGQSDHRLKVRAIRTAAAVFATTQEDLS